MRDAIGQAAAGNLECAGENRLRAMKNLIVQSRPDRRQVNAVVDDGGALRGPLVDIVHGAQTDEHAQHIVHEFHDTVHRGVSDHRQPERGLLQPAPGDRQREQQRVGVVGRRRREELIQRGADFVHVSVDERAAHAVPGGQGADSFGAREGLHGDRLAPRYSPPRV